jgi:esterase/lipase
MESQLDKYPIWVVVIAVLVTAIASNIKQIIAIIGSLLNKASPARTERQKLRTASENGERQRQHLERTDMLSALSVIVENEQAQQNKMQDEFNKRLNSYEQERQQTMDKLLDLFERNAKRDGDIISALMLVAGLQREVVNRLDRLCELLETRRIVTSSDPVAENYGR